MQHIIFPGCDIDLRQTVMDRQSEVWMIEIKQKIWLEKDGHIVFGKGRDRLFRAIDECRSLSAAVKKLDMTYRGAWGRLKASEERLKIRLVEPCGKGMRLTPEGRTLLEEYDKLMKGVDSLVNRSASRFKRLLESCSGPNTIS
jgi:molybdate transport system regulatory protein